MDSELVEGLGLEFGVGETTVAVVLDAVGFGADTQVDVLGVEDLDDCKFDVDLPLGGAGLEEL